MGKIDRGRCCRKAWNSLVWRQGNKSCAWNTSEPRQKESNRQRKREGKSKTDSKRFDPCLK